MKEPLFSRHTATMLQYIGIGLISGAISHGFFSGYRSVVTAIVGVIVFILGLVYERKILNVKNDMGKILLIGIIFSISTAMVAGGIQHFLDSPWRSVWIIPLGYCISLLVFREKEGIKNSFLQTFGLAIIIAGIVFVVCYVLAQITPSYSHAKINMSENDIHMVDHSTMVISEESFIVNMIPHHQEAVDTARLIETRGFNPLLRELAQDIITAQEKEIVMMKKWVVDWNYSSIQPSYENMMGDGTLLSGKALDEWFLKGMILHHEGAVQMAEALLKLNARKEVSDFAKEVIRVQNAEIGEMKKMLGNDMNHEKMHE